MSHLLYPVDTVEIGSRKEWTNEATICAVFHDFKYIEKSKNIDSPTLQCHGHDWQIRICRGNVAKDMFVSLVNKGTINVRVFFSTTICNETKAPSNPINLKPGKTSSDVFDYNNMEEILDSHGSLKVYMTIVIYQPLELSSIIGKSSIWTPPKRNLVNEMRQKLESGKGADIVFQVNGTLFPANKEIVMQGAHTFSEILEEDFATVTHNHAASNQQAKDNIENHGSIPMDEVPIDGVDPSHFQLLLQFLYTDELHLDLKNMDLETILQVANRFGCIRLKLLIEAEIVKHKVDANNAIDMLLFAEAQSCALLKEKALDVFATNPNEVMASAGWTIVEESNELWKELMSALASRTQKPKSSSDSFEHMMSVAKLREELYKKGLDVDGTREMLVARLTERNDSTP